MFNLPAYPTLNYLLPLGFVIFIVLFLVFLVLSVLFVRMLTQASSIKEKSARIYEEANTSLKQAQEQAFSLIADANKSAEKVLEDASYMSQEMSERFDSQMEEVAKEGTDFIGETTDNLLKAHRKALLEASKGNITSMREVSDEFKKGLSGEIMEFRKGLDIISAEAKRKLESELVQHKQSRIKSIDDTVYKLIEEATTKIIGNSMNLQDHEQFILICRFVARE
jgi:competence protein ComGC